MNSIVEEMVEYSSKTISHRIRNIPGFIDMSFGEPWFGPPPQAQEIAASAVEDAGLFNAYAEPQGSLSLRSVISERYMRRYGIEIKPENVLITHGACGAFCTALLALTEYGDEVILTEPTYMLYERVIRIFGRVPIYVKALCRFTSNEQDNLIKSTGGKAKLLVVNSPENPTGHVYTHDEMSAIAKFCEKYGLWLIHDEVYDDFVYGSKHVPALALGFSKVVQLNSFSKRYGLPGIRIGWLVAPKKVIKNASKIHDYCYFSVNVLAQAVAEKLLTDKTIANWLSEQCKELDGRRQRLLDVIDKSMAMTTEDTNPSGAFFVFPKVTEFGKQLVQADHNPNLSIGELFADYLLEKHRVAVVPGFVYGKSVADNFRIVTAVKPTDFEIALERFSHI